MNYVNADWSKTENIISVKRDLGKALKKLNANRMEVYFSSEKGLCVEINSPQFKGLDVKQRMELVTKAWKESSVTSLDGLSINWTLR